MNKTILKLAIAGILLSSSVVGAEPVAAKLVMGGGRSWTGKIIGRDGDWIEFKTGNAPRPIRVGANTIVEVVFKMNLDTKKVSEMMRNREFEQVIAAVDEAIKPFDEYSDIPSNLTRYNMLLIELYYRTEQYDKSMAISSKIAEDDRNPELQQKSRVYQVLALIGDGKSAEATALLAKYGWDQDLSDDSAPAQLYIAAKLMALNQQYHEAMEMVAKVIAFNGEDTEWLPSAELFCAEVYLELGLYESAAEVCRQIEVLYKDTSEFDKAMLLKIKIEKLHAEKKLRESLESEEA